MKNKGGNISLRQAMSMLKDGNVVLMDVTSKEEYAKFHLKKSIHVPMENFQKIAPRYIKSKNQKVIVYCSSGVRSLAAYELLKDLGYKNVYNIYGGVGG